MPTPREGQTKDEFIHMCIPVVLEEGTAKNPQQAAAICNSIWEQEKKNKHTRYEQNKKTNN